MIQEKINAIDEVLLSTPIYTGTTLDGFVAPIFGVKSVPIFIEQFSIVAPQIRVVLAPEYKEINNPKVSIVLPITKEVANQQNIEIRSGQKALVTIPLSQFQLVQGEILIDVIISPELTSDLKFTNIYNYSVMDLNNAKETKGSFQVDQLFSIQGISNLPLPQKLALKLKEIFTPNHVLLTESGLEEYIEYFKFVAQLYVESGNSIPELKSSIDQLISELTTPSHSKNSLEKRVEIRRILAFMANLSSKALVAIEASYIEAIKAQGIEQHLAVMQYSASHILGSLIYEKQRVTTNAEEDESSISVVTTEKEIEEDEQPYLEPTRAQSFNYGDTVNQPEAVTPEEQATETETETEVVIETESEFKTETKQVSQETEEEVKDEEEVVEQVPEEVEEESLVEELSVKSKGESEQVEEVEATSENIKDDIQKQEEDNSTYEDTSSATENEALNDLSEDVLEPSIETEEEVVASDEEQAGSTGEVNGDETNEDTSQEGSASDEENSTLTEEEIEERRRARLARRGFIVEEQTEYTFNPEALKESDQDKDEDTDAELLALAGSLAEDLK